MLVKPLKSVGCLLHSAVDQDLAASDSEELDIEDTFLTPDDIDELLKSPST